MKDLIENVHSAVSNYCAHTGLAVGGKCVDCARITRDVVEAVLEHYSEAGNVTQDMVYAAYDEFTGEAENEIAAAMRAELERLRGDK